MDKKFVSTQAKTKYLNWYTISLIAIAVEVMSKLMGGVAGSLFGILTIVLFLFSVSEASRSGLDGKSSLKERKSSKQITDSITVLLINFAIFGVLIQLFK